MDELATDDSVDLDESEIGDVVQEYELQVLYLRWLPTALFSSNLMLLMF